MARDIGAAMKEPVIAGVNANPFREDYDDGNYDTDGAARFCSENGYPITSAGMIARRAYGKAPAFYKVGMAVRYTERALREFLKTAGLSTRDFDKPKREAPMSASEKARRAGK